MPQSTQTARAAQTTMVQAIRDTLRDEMERDPSVLLLGEDIGRDGGVFRATEGLIDRFGADRVTSDPMESAYTAVLLWKAAVEKADSFEVADIQEASGGVSVDAPEGTVTIDGENHHVTKTARVGKVVPSGLIDQVWQSPEPITPDPFLKNYPWAEGITG